MDLDTLKNQLNTTESQMSQYTSNLPSEIQTEVQKAYTPLLQESLGVTKNLMSDYLGRYFDVTGMGPGMQGTSAVDLSPSQKLGVMGRELGTMSGNLQASQKYSDYLGAQMNDLYGKAVQASQLGYQNLADQYARQMQQYQMAWQEAENAKDRALQRSLSGSGGGWTPGNYVTEGEVKTPTQQDILRGIQQVANTIASQRKPGGTYSYGGQNYGNIDQVYKSIITSAKNNYNLNLNPQWLWQQLGNNIGPMSVNALL